MEKDQHFTQPPARYTEATLVQARWRKSGVGRPSTYAPIIATIQDREYVIKKDKRLCADAARRGGDRADDRALPRHHRCRVHGRIWSSSSTRSRTDKRRLEDRPARFLSAISTSEMEDAEKALDGVRIKVPDEETDEICELCGRNMVVKSGRFGRFLACPGYPGVQEYEAASSSGCRAAARKLRQWDAQAQVQKGLCLLRLRARRGVRLYDVGRAHGAGLPESAGRRCSRNPAAAR